MFFPSTLLDVSCLVCLTPVVKEITLVNYHGKVLVCVCVWGGGGGGGEVWKSSHINLYENRYAHYFSWGYPYIISMKLQLSTDIMFLMVQLYDMVPVT